MEQLEQQLIDKLAQSLASIASNHVPLDVRLWDAEDCAKYLKMGKQTFLNRFACAPKFPKPVRLEHEKGQSLPRWRASDVIKYALGR